MSNDLENFPQLCAYAPTTFTYTADCVVDRLDALKREYQRQPPRDIQEKFCGSKVLGISTSAVNNLELRNQEQVKKEIKKVAEKVTSSKRVVQVFIVDADKHIPTEKALLYKSEQTFTDLTDQELFFEIDIKPLLEAHNNFRKTVTRQLHTSAERVYLEPIKIRDLKMVVATLAEF